MRDQVASDDGVAIVYETHGVGPRALVFVHGWSCDRGYWRGQLNHFAREHQVVAIDLAGHGESGAERTDWTIEAFGSDVAAVVQKLGLDAVILIGHSMGGDVILEAARRLRGRVRALIWVDTYQELDHPSSPEAIDRFTTSFRADFVNTTRAFVRGLFRADSDPALVERVASDMSASPPEVAVPSLDSAMKYGREVPRVLRELRLPVVAINPDYKSVDEASLLRHGVKTVVMPGVSHFLPLEDPERFNRLLGSAVDDLLRAG
jgi:pimeloyl-ACP methyl ester carboxylesterase